MQSFLIKKQFFKPILFFLFTFSFWSGAYLLAFFTRNTPIHNSISLSLIITALLLLSFASLLSLIVLLFSLIPKLTNRTDILFAICLCVILISRFLCVHFQYPDILYHSFLFSQESISFYSLQINPGIFLIDAGFFVILATCYFRFYGSRQRRIKNKTRIILYSFFSLFFVTSIFIGFVFINNHIIFSNNFILNTNKITFFNFHSFITLFIFFCYSYGFSLITFKTIKTIIINFRRDLKQCAILFATFFILLLLISVFLFPHFNQAPSYWLLLSLFLYYAVVFAIVYNKEQYFHFLNIFLNILFFSALTTFILASNLHKVEDNFRNNMVDRIIHDNSFNIQNLFNDERSDITSEYSYAYFKNNILIDQEGEYQYGYHISNYFPEKNNRKYIDIRGYRHYLYKINENEHVVISHSCEFNINKMASFAFFFIIYSFFFLFIFAVTLIFIRVKFRKLSFRHRILFTLLFSMLLLSITVCFLSINLFMNNIIDKYQDIFKDKMETMSFYIAGDDFCKMETKGEIDSLKDKINQISTIFDTDIYIYDKKGALLVANNSILKSNISHQLDEALMEQLYEKKISLLIQKELEESKLLLKVYKPIITSNGVVCGVIHFNFNSKPSEFKSDLSYLLNQFLTLYCIIIILSILISWGIYLFISQPLEDLGKILNINKLKGGKNKIKMAWSGNDEIGSLIKEHNNMVELLRENAERLAASERKTAWREMAQEIAHEIKNPLTPMKLSIQMLQHTWENHNADFDVRLNKTINQLLLQIDRLTQTANLFHDFAISENVVISEQSIVAALHTFQQNLPFDDKIVYHFNYDSNLSYLAYIDNGLFVKMLNYLADYSYQNCSPDRELIIDISLSDINNTQWLLKFSDNGKGIVREKTPFNFNFSTNSCISCLGLPIVKNIVLGFNGKITYSTEDNIGTEFYIYIPKSL